ncbi:MAG: hypothetical protein ABSD64_08065 [Terriglobales bacterium]|jgi:plastocyanin
MSAARHIPMEEVVQTISIDSTFTPTPQAVKVLTGTEIEFVNNSGSTINITFNPNPPGSPPPAAQLLFSPIGNISPGGSSTPQSPQSANGSTNYMVNMVGGASYGPFAIQVGNGPLYIQVNYSNNAASCNPGEVVIPVGGQLQMVNTDSNSYSVGWGPGITNPFNPALTSVGGQQGNAIHQATAGAGTYTYTATKTSTNEVPSSGGGKIIIKSS